MVDNTKVQSAGGNEIHVGRKLDAGKSPLLQGVLAYFPNALAAVGKVSEYGKEKYKLQYEDKNWSRVEGGLGRYGDALARHTTRHAAGESHDPESRLLHVAHAAWNALAVLELVLRREPLKDESERASEWMSQRAQEILNKTALGMGPYANSDR